jgi:hypothetical protein
MEYDVSLITELGSTTIKWNHNCNIDSIDKQSLSPNYLQQKLDIMGRMLAEV